MAKVIDGALKKLAKEALNVRGQARTFRTAVGVAIETYDGQIFAGFNIETYAHKGYHAEEVALIRGLAAGYNKTDFKRLVVVFQDPGHQELELYPACALSCWGWLWEFTHPRFQIVVADTDGKIYYAARLNEIIHPPPPGQVFPSFKIMGAKPKKNSKPKLPLHAELQKYPEIAELYQLLKAVEV